MTFSSSKQNDLSDSMQGMWMEIPSYIWELVPVTTRKPQLSLCSAADDNLLYARDSNLATTHSG